MKIVGISGSPTKSGNNERIIDYVLDIAKQKGHGAICNFLFGAFIGFPQFSDSDSN